MFPHDNGDWCRIIVRASSYAVLTHAAEGLCRLLAPTAWQYVYIPVLPHNLIGYLDAPMPFLMGVHSAVRPFFAFFVLNPSLPCIFPLLAKNPRLYTDFKGLDEPGFTQNLAAA